MSDCRKCAEFDWCVENEDCGLFKPKPQTNADRIRAMTDEELARFVTKEDLCALTCGEPCIPCDGKCESHMLAWLKSPVEANNG